MGIVTIRANSIEPLVQEAQQVHGASSMAENFSRVSERLKPAIDVRVKTGH